MKRWSAVVVFALVLLTGCASVRPGLLSTNPAESEVQAVRSAALKIAETTRVALVIVGEIGKYADTLPIPSSVKDGIDCGVIKVVGTTGTPDAVITRICGTVPDGPGPLIKALEKMKDVTERPGLRATILTMLDVIDPLLAKIDDVGNPALAAMAATLRASFSFARAFLSGSQP